MVCHLFRFGVATLCCRDVAETQGWKTARNLLCTSCIMPSNRILRKVDMSQDYREICLVRKKQIQDFRFARKCHSRLSFRSYDDVIGRWAVRGSPVTGHSSWPGPSPRRVLACRGARPACSRAAVPRPCRASSPDPVCSLQFRLPGSTHGQARHGHASTLDDHPDWDLLDGVLPEVFAAVRGSELLTPTKAVAPSNSPDSVLFLPRVQSERQTPAAGLWPGYGTVWGCAWER